MKYIIYGAGLYGLTLGRLLKDSGHQVLIKEATDHIGGMLETERVNGVEIHKHGAHIFHTDNDRVIEFVNKYSNWTPYKHEVVAMIKILGKTKYVHLPLSYQTLVDLYDLDSERVDIKEICEYLLNSSTRKQHPNKSVNNLIGKIGWDLFEYIIKGYSELQWGTKFENINPEVIERIGLTKDFNTYYFKDKFQALPKDGYDVFLNNLSKGLSIEFNSKFEYDDSVITIFTGAIDDLLSREVLPYRSLTWRTEYSERPLFPFRYPVVNTPQNKTFTRIILHNNFVRKNILFTKYITSYEYPTPWVPGLVRYYPVNNEVTDKIYNEALVEVKSKYPNLIMGGRIGSYKYYDMDDTILAAMNLFDELCKK